MAEDIFYYDANALMDRLSTGARRSSRSIAFLFGSGVTAPRQSGEPGVPGAEEIVKLIRAEFENSEQEAAFDNAISTASNRYQSAFQFLLGRRSQELANEIIKRAVWHARKKLSQHPFQPSVTTTDQICSTLDSDLEGWFLNPAVEAIGKLVAYYPEQFGRQLLTTNFDPLLGVAIEINGGRHFRTVLQRDGNLSQTVAPGCHVVYLHGYWHGADTLHTSRQLMQERPRLKHSLSELLKDKTIVVCGYGGWDDIFTKTLLDVALDDTAKPEILWTFRSPAPSPQQKLIELLSPGIDRGRVNLYSGVDCHTFFPDLLSRWAESVPPQEVYKPAPASSRIKVHMGTQLQKQSQQNLRSSVERSDDNPPLVDICVGRDQELAKLLGSFERACFVTGFGGHGKSTLSAQYFSEVRKRGTFDKFVWVDCKEQSERFENRLISIIVRESRGALSGNDLSHLSIEALSQQLIRAIATTKYLFVFDNIDHYVDLENNVLTANANTFLQVFLAASSPSRVIFTCRPSVQYAQPDVSSLRLEGLNLSATKELFSRRGAKATDEDIAQAHILTGGHAFWLDLLAAQVAKASETQRLSDILSRMKQRGEIPFATLESIWPELHDNQKAVLRGMAETVKPETDVQIGEYLKFQMNFSRVNRALRSLRNLNLIVVRPSEVGDAFELHPLVREFVQSKFPYKDRITFIDAILSVYARIMQIYTKQPKEAFETNLLHNWTESAEICLSAGKFNDAFQNLSAVRDAFLASEFPGEYARVARDLFKKIDWSDFGSYSQFDMTFTVFLRIVANLDRRDEVEDLLSKYAATVASRDARYINYCDLRCYACWIQQRYEEAIEWGTRGKDLKKKSNVDTHFDTEYHLALAQRDAGVIDPALQYFLGGRDLGSIIDPDEFDEGTTPSFYGNIGRCLHLMGQIEPALICYRKSAIRLEAAGERHVENQGYVRHWIGELLLAKDDYCAGSRFLSAAKSKWQLVSPARNAAVEEALAGISDKLSDCAPLDDRNIERYCVAWIFGRERDFVEISS
ncbi:NB-ARC domain-containing protein [Bradyrhizobium symbiodeficiens]|uniref:NB-ARC domain-containing protein n=1 Tax=Bradyrhizobium symbiodeficiens TaxID=1404367 RepID=A0A6G9A1U6_9BRAD|nr:NB-ARC domain-containing protein [Bradyrhizobium symbiodeficiens]QIP06420.1 hypothetical protein HAV00_09265 [Bradyrhizobium symbiodeficiens]